MLNLSLFTLLLLAADPARPPRGSLLLWDGDSEEKSGIVQLAKVSDGGVEGKCLEAWWPEPPKRTNPVIVFGARRPDFKLAGYGELWFYAKASEAGRSFTVELRQWSGRIAVVEIEKYIDGGKLTTEWKQVRIPLEALAPNENWQNEADHIVFAAKDKQRRKLLPTKLFVDEVYLVPGMRDAETESRGDGE